MIAKISICSVSISILILKTTSNLIHPDYSVKMFNTENMVLSLGDFDDDLEVIKTDEDDPELDEKLLDFHKYVNVEEKSVQPKKKYTQLNEMLQLPIKQVEYPDSPFEVALNEKHLSMLERRRNLRKKRRQRHQNERTMEERLAARKNDIVFVFPAQSNKVNDEFEMYDSLEKNYHDFLAKTQSDGTAFKFSDEGKPEETIGDMFGAIFDKSPPKNCSKVLPIGIQAVECIVQDFNEGRLDKGQLLYNLSQILAIWFAIYLAIALPLWCYKGWCCCCCKCNFCYPNKTVQDIQRYLAENPPGTYTNPNGKESQYNPTQKEIELYERLRRSIAEYY